ncbi:aminotransferase class I/II-fold pyridoxal phosphate-dependent enzyme [Haliangium sp.]|uniref:aminotransferase class I/II-fold pyridoxal phosphate-dependent enzyme n=1 Tax=Haliangium sp. TaxID=2663208 RepID=UPI003D0AB384
MKQQQHNFIDTIYQVFDDGIKRGIAQLSTSDDRLDGRALTIGRQRVLNFGSCSYMGLETDARLVEAVKAAVDRFGSQFSSSRAYLSLGLYDVLEDKLEDIFERPTIVGASTSLLHLAALPVLVQPGDAVILDQMVHASVQSAAQLLKARGIKLELVRHGRLDQLERKVIALKGEHRRIWYLGDGLYSMFGDYAPVYDLMAMAERHENLWLYLDDAHGMGWTGPRGCGYVHSRIGGYDKLVLTASLNKSFAAAGGAIVLPNRDLAQRVRSCGPTFIFSGPIQPPMLGACIASAELHLSDELSAMQAQLAERIHFTNDTIRALGLPQLAENDAPLFFIPVGLPKLVYRLVEELHDAGFHVNGGVFPAVPMLRGGVRFTITRHLSQADIRAMLECLHGLYQRMAAEEGITPESLAQAFRCPALAERDWAADADADADADAGPEPEAPIPTLSAARASAARSHHSRRGLTLRTDRRLSRRDRPTWDRLFAGRGPMSAQILDDLARVFAAQADPTQHMDLRYVWVEDEHGAPVLTSFYVVALVKDDMFESAETSRAIEAVRATNPMHLTSRAVIMGSPVSAGDHLYLDRAHPRWRTAVGMLIDELKGTMVRERASRIMLRDFVLGADDELRDVMLENGLFEYRLPDKLVLDDLSWRSRDEYLGRLGQKYRYNVRKEAMAFEHHFEVETAKPRDRRELEQCYELYCQVQQRGAEVNVFRLPLAYFAAICADPAYDLVRLYLHDDPREQRRPVAVMFSHVVAGRYTALVVGLDYDLLHSHKVYKQVLFQTVQRAHALGCERLDLGFTATLEKKKLGARPTPTCAYVMLDDHFSAEVIQAVA